MKFVVLLGILIFCQNLCFCQVSDEDLTEKFKAQRYRYLTLLELGHKSFKEEEYPKAIEYLVSAVKHSREHGPKDYKPYEELGDTYSRQGRRDDAVWAYNEAIKIIAVHFKDADGDSARQRLQRKIGDVDVELILPPMEFSDIRAKVEEEFKHRKREIMAKVNRKHALRELRYAISDVGKIALEEVIATYQKDPKASHSVKARYETFIGLILSYQRIIELSTLEIFSAFQTEPKKE